MDSSVGQVGLPLATAAVSAASPRYGAPAAASLWEGLQVGQDAKQKRMAFDADRRQRAQLQDMTQGYVADQVNSGKMNQDEAQFVDLLQNAGDHTAVTRFLQNVAQGKNAGDLMPYDQAANAPAPPVGSRLTTRTDRGTLEREGMPYSKPAAPKPPAELPSEHELHAIAAGVKLQNWPDWTPQRAKAVIAEGRAPKEPKEPKEDKVKPVTKTPSKDALVAIAHGRKLSGWPDWTPEMAQAQLDDMRYQGLSPAMRMIEDQRKGKGNKGSVPRGTSAPAAKKDDPLGIIPQ